MTNTRKILVVDDDPVVRKNFEEILTGKGYALNAVATGEDAMWELAHGRYDAVFTEIVMRGMSGLEVAEEIHARQPGLPVIVVTAHSSAAAEERAAAAGVAEFLHKPLTPEQLAEVAARVMRAAEPAAASQFQAGAAEALPAQEAATLSSRLRNVALFLVAPFVGLFYILIFPVIGLGMLASLFLSGETQKPEEEAEPLQPVAPDRLKVPKTIAMAFVATVIGIAFAVVAPLLGIGVVLWLCFQAWGKLGAKVIKT